MRSLKLDTPKSLSQRVMQRLRQAIIDGEFALGAAISAAVAAGGDAGGYGTFEGAQAAMTSIKEKSFHPDPSAQAVYDELYGIYLELHDAFGGVEGGRGDIPSVMKRLLALRNRVIRPSE